MWAQVDAENPRVWELFVKFTFELIQRGFTHHSAYAVMHRGKMGDGGSDHGTPPDGR